MDFHLSAVSIALTVTSVLYLYVNLGCAHWRELVRCDPGAATNELVFDLAMVQWGWRRWKALLVFGWFVALWPAFLTLGAALAAMDQVRS